MGTIRIGIVGAGSISNYHLKAYRNNKEAEIYAVCDMNAQRAEDQAAEYGASKVYRCRYSFE